MWNPFRKTNRLADELRAESERVIQAKLVEREKEVPKQIEVIYKMLRGHAKVGVQTVKVPEELGPICDATVKQLKVDGFRLLGGNVITYDRFSFWGS